MIDLRALDIRGFFRALTATGNSPLAVYLLLSLAAIPFLDLSGATALRGGSGCHLLHDGIWRPAIRVFATVLCALLVLLANSELFGYLFVISGRRDPQFPHDRRVAVVLSCALFLCLILLYGTLYFIHVPCLHAFVPARIGAGRLIAEVVNAFYFSAATITTLGYGDFSPKGYLFGEMIAAMEAINGLVAFGVFTGALAGLIASRNREQELKKTGDERPKGGGPG